MPEEHCRQAKQAPKCRAVELQSTTTPPTVSSTIPNGLSRSSSHTPIAPSNSRKRKEAIRQTELRQQLG